MNHSTPAPATVTDPVCGMTLDPARSAGASGYDGQTITSVLAAAR